MRILWLSRHAPLPEQVAALEKKFGSVEIVQISKTVSSAAEVVELLRENNCEEMVVVLPVPILADLTNPRICPVKPIRAVMDRIPTGRTNEKGEPEFEFIFSHFERVEKVEVVTSPL
ncbi:hypothetical protein BSNK01_12140 [Bacillaceae bacterium]